MFPAFGDYLYELLRKRDNMSMRAFAKLVGVPPSHFSEIRKGRRKAPWDQAVYWADVLKLSGDERTSFLDKAALTATPDRIRNLLADAEKAYGGTLRELIAKPPKRRTAPKGKVG